MEMKDIYVEYNTEICTQSVGMFYEIIEKQFDDDIENLHLLLNSPGGSVRLALGLAHLLEQLPCKVMTYNMHRVDSAAIALFCSGSERFCLPSSSFLAHTVHVELQGRYSPNTLKIEYMSLLHDYEDMIAYLSSRTTIPSVEWERHLSEEGHFFMVDEAIQSGLATSTYDGPFGRPNKNYYSITSRV